MGTLGRLCIVPGCVPGAPGVIALAHFKGPDDRGEQVEAGYAYGQDNENNGFVVFAFSGDIDEGKDGRVAKEDVLIRTRWSDRNGRADIIATHGDLGGNWVHGSQCWDATFVSTYESFKLDGVVLAQDGDAATCVFEDAELPSNEELPGDGAVENPYGDMMGTN